MPPTVPAAPQPLRLPGPRVRHMSDQGLEWLAGLEGGYKLKAYRNGTGIPTLGAGQTFLILPGGRRRVEMTDGFDSIEAARFAFKRFVLEADVVVDAALRDDINQFEFDTFTSLCYNIGDPRFLKSTAVRRFNARGSNLSVAEAISWWNKSDNDPEHEGVEIDPGLVERRSCEIDLYLRGIYRLQRRVAK